MRIVRAGDDYDIGQWTSWLQIHGADINDVRSVDIHDNGKVVLHVYDQDVGGFRYVRDGEEEAALLPPVVIRNPLMPPPPFKERVRR